MELKTVSDLIAMNNSTDVEAYAKTVNRQFNQRIIEMKRLEDRDERRAKALEFKSDSDFFKAELIKYMKYVRLFRSDVCPKRRYST